MIKLVQIIKPFSKLSQQPVRLIALEIGALLLVILVIALLFSSAAVKSSTSYEVAFDKKDKGGQLLDQEVCLVGRCMGFDGNTTLSVTKELSHTRSVSFLLRAAQVDDAGLVDINNGTYTIFVKDGQVKATMPKSFFSLLPFFSDDDPHYTVFINGKKTATLFPFYWQLVTVSFDQALPIQSMQFGKGFVGTMDQATFSSDTTDEATAQKSLDVLLAKIKK